MKMKELRDLNRGELQKIFIEKQHMLRDLRFEIAQGKVKNAKTIRITRKDIARILTVLNTK